jgi:glycosyltransferase involved in cell wall biosynthesis
MREALFIHNGSPGRFEFIGRALVERGWSCKLINGETGRDIPGVETLRWAFKSPQAENGRGPRARFQRDLSFGYATAQAALSLRDRGFNPQVIIGHPGWGEMLFLHHIFPSARQIQIAEFFYCASGGDVGFDPEFSPPPVSLDDALSIEAKNFGLATSYARAACLVAPTSFQASLLPKPFLQLTRVLHEGVETQMARTRPAKISVTNGLTLDGAIPVITFVNRHFEPLRGVHVFMRALPAVQRALPEAHVVMVGADRDECYGPKAPAGTTWLQVLKKELGSSLDYNRIHFPGHIGYDQLIDLFSVSWAHVYWTYPFVLSWSLLDAMACSALIVGSDTPPVRDLLRHRENGLLLDFFDVEGLGRTLVGACREPERFSDLRRAARETVVSGYDRKSICLPRWLALVEEMAARGDAVS